jgi:hypothetical protein
MVAALIGLLSLIGTAQAKGGYETNHTDVAWHTLETEHFYIHWPESERPKDDPHWFTTEFTAGQLARIAEDAYPKICGQFDYFLSEKVHVVVYDQDRGWEGNGFAIAEYDWTGFAARWGPTFRQRGRAEFLEDVFVHEFAHIVSLKAYLPLSEGSTGFQIGGLVEDEEWARRWGFKPKPRLNADVGFDMLLSAHAPFWWAEGGAEYWSERAGTNVWGDSRDAILRMSVHEDRVLSIEEWTTRIDKTGFDGERGYNHGYAFSRWLRETTGKDLVTDMAKKSGEGWHWSWDAVVQEATGESMDTLYARWRSHLEQHYGAQIAEVEASGVVAGKALSAWQPMWEAQSGAWTAMSKSEQDAEQDGFTAYKEMSRYSPDGRFVAWFDEGLNIQQMLPEEWGAISGKYVAADDTKLEKALERRAIYEGWAEYYRPAWSPDSKHIVVTGPEDFTRKTALGRLAMDHGLSIDADGYNWTQLIIGSLDESGKKLKARWQPVPNTLRALESAWSPNGKWLAFSRYGDGTHNIWTIAPDGTEAVQRTQFDDGTQVQGLSFTPDGRGLLVSLFRAHRQDLWFMDLSDNSLHRITDSVADETDPVVGPDGRAWFAANLNGIFNVYTYDPVTAEVHQQTNVLGGTYGPDPAPGGHLLYTAITGHGFRIKAIPAAELMAKRIEYPGLCKRTGCKDDAAFLARKPAGVDAAAESRPYSAWRSMMPLAGWPVMRTTEGALEAGAAFYLGDYVEGHYLEGEATVGKDNALSFSYWNSQLWPNIMLGYSRYSYKGHYGYGQDEDGLAQTSDDTTVVDVKFEQASDDLWSYASFQASDTLWLGFGADASRYSFRDTGDGPRFVPYTLHAGASAFIEWSPWGAGSMGDDWINPRGGRRLYLDYAHRWTSLVDPDLAGGIYDDGQRMGQYRYNQVLGTWTEYIPWTFFGLWDRGTLQLDLEGGWIDRNVMGWDELMGGGRHPYHWGSGTIGNNVQFSGYEGYSLTGETMLIANGAYRFPLIRDLNWKHGPVYTESMYLQIFGSVGNLWSYRVEGPSHVEGYSVVPDAGRGRVRREVPFKDYASKNSPQGAANYVLTDVGAELRVRSFIWNDWDWDSFLRVAYGLQSTAGYGDVNADLVQSSAARDASSELSDEVEPPTMRVYLGVGTGW